MTAAALSHPAITIASGATFTYRVVEHPSGMVIVFASGSGLAEHEVARFAPLPDGKVAFRDALEPRLNDTLDEGTAHELAVTYAEHLAESDDQRYGF